MQLVDAGNKLDRVAFGRRLRLARKRLGWTLVQLADASGVSISTISRAERGQIALSYENFSALGRALQMDMETMFSEAGATTQANAGPVVTRAGRGVVYEGRSVSYEFLGTSTVGKRISPMLGIVHARHVLGPEDFVRHPGEEFVHVLSGTIEVHFETGEKVRLGKGDSLYFQSTLGHAYISVSRQHARIVGVTTDGNMRQQERRPPGTTWGP